MLFHLVNVKQTIRTDALIGRRALAGLGLGLKSAENDTDVNRADARAEGLRLIRTTVV